LQATVKGFVPRLAKATQIVPVKSKGTEIPPGLGWAILEQERLLQTPGNREKRKC
jgi:hypothetical protein